MSAQWREVITAVKRMHNTPIVDDDFPEMKYYYQSAQQKFDKLPPMPTIVCLCGSTKFKDEFLEASRQLTTQGKIVVSVGWFSHADGIELDDEFKNKLDELHKRKIDLADEIFVINVDGYIGSSTRSEIDYAKSTNKPVKYLEYLDMVKSEIGEHVDG